MNQTSQLESQQETSLGTPKPHPSGLAEDYLAYVSMSFWMQRPTAPVMESDWHDLLMFQKGFQAAVEFARSYHGIEL